MKLFLFLSFFAINAFAGIEAFSTSSAQKLFLEEGMKSEADVYYVKFTGVKGEWSDKVFNVKKTKRNSDQYTYSFDYKLVLSNGSHDRTYQLITDEGFELVNGTRVRRIKLWTPEFGRDGIVFVFDKDLTEKSQKLSLEEQGKKKAFVPEVI